MTFGAATSQTLAIYGLFPRTAAWGLAHTAAVLAAPAVAVLLEADLIAAGLAHIAAHMTVAVLIVTDIGRQARRHGLLVRPPIDWRMGAADAWRSLPLAARTFIDSFRQQGFRIVLGAFVGAGAVTTLATTRTFANVLHQGLSTITAPLLPELMRYVVNRDQDRVEGAFGIVWLTGFALLVPGVLLLTLLAEPVFLYWTCGAVSFDAVLFLTLLVAVLVYAAGQPALSILQGRNRVAWQIGVSVAAAVLLAGLALALVPAFGIRGAGFALLGAEIGAVAMALMGAQRTLQSIGLVFPLRSLTLVLGNIAATFALALAAVTVLAERPLAIAAPLAVNLMLGWLYWKTLPGLARDRIRTVLAKARLVRGRAAVRTPD
jgi:O-antigen/teichoic acid export membrane protein